MGDPGRGGLLLALSLGLGAGCVFPLPSPLFRAVDGGFVCDFGRADCNGDGTDGCEMDVQSSAQNCGRCGRDCLGGACEAGHCLPVVIAPSPQETQGPTAGGIAVDGTSVYFTLPDTGAVVRMAKDGTGRAPLAIQVPSPLTLVLRNHTLAWSSNGGDGGIWSVDTTGASLNPLALNQNAEWGGIALDDDSVYWANNEGFIGHARRSVAGWERLFPGEPITVRSVAEDGDRLYWTTGVQGDLVRGWKDGGSREVLAGKLGTVMDLALDADFVYVADWDQGGRILKVSKATGAWTVAAEAQGGAHALVGDVSGIYWGNQAALLRLAPDGGVETVAPRFVHRIGLDDVAVYWTDYDNSVMKRAK